MSQYRNSAPQDDNEEKYRNNLLSDIQKYSQWNDEKKMESALVEFLEKYPDEKELADEKAAFGKYLKGCGDKAFRLGSTGKSRAELDKLLDEMRRRNVLPYQIRNAEKSFEKGALARNRSKEQQRIKQSNQSSVLFPDVVGTPINLNIPLKNVPRKERNMKIHPNFPTDLSPAPGWTILIDETGSHFTKETFSNDIRENQKGKMVALLVPDGFELPSLDKAWHAVDANQESIQENIQTILNSPCGILGIPVESLNPIDADLWFSCLETLLGLVLRLLPLNGETKIRLLVEQRGDVQPKDKNLLEKTCNDVLHHLARSFPEKAKMISFLPRIIRKADHAWNGYVDAAAFLWGSTGQKDLLRSTGWLNTCFLGTKPERLREALDFMEKFEFLRPEDWSALILRPEAALPNSLVSILLKDWGEETRQNPTRWNNCLNYVQEHLYSKEVRMEDLSKQIDWLKKYRPEECFLLPQLQLVWLTVQLAESNHLGKTDAFRSMNREFGKLCKLLYFEDATLVCCATLHIAVAFMNALDFRRATCAVQMWNDTPIEVAGRQYHGQVLSTYGQLLAFSGRNEEAKSLFNRALEQFQLLSDIRQGALDARQTRAYLLIAMMDSPETSELEMNKELTNYFGVPLEEAIDRLAPSSAPGEKYARHVLLRYLLQRGTDAQRARYLAARENWRQDSGHPWELILFYRALLVEDEHLRNSILRQAFELAMGGGATLKLIGGVILGALRYFDPACVSELKTLTAEVIAELPALEKRREKALLQQADAPIPPLELAQIVLPFNFR